MSGEGRPMESGEVPPSLEFLTPQGDIGAPDWPTHSEAPITEQTELSLGSMAIKGASADQPDITELDRKMGEIAIIGATSDQPEISSGLGATAFSDSGSVTDAVSDSGDSGDNRPGNFTVREGADFPPDLIGRTERHEQQGANETSVPDGDYAGLHTFEGTCGVAASSQAMSDATGRYISEQDVLDVAMDPSSRDLGLVTEPSDAHPPSKPESSGYWGGTTADGRAELISKFGVDSSVERNVTVEGLANRVESGDQVLAAVNTGDIWPADSPGEELLRARESASPSPNHVVFVTGIERDAAGEISGIVTNDTGLAGDDGAGVVYDADNFRSAWQDRGGILNTIRRPGEQP